MDILLPGHMPSISMNDSRMVNKSLLLALFTVFNPQVTGKLLNFTIKFSTDVAGLTFMTFLELLMRTLMNQLEK